MADASGMTSRLIRTVEPAGEIHWHVEQRGGGPDIVLVPSGEGDCSSFDTVAHALATDYRVTTFDAPGFSRSITTGDVEISIPALASQVACLVCALDIERATFYGCSSAGVALLDLVTEHAPLVHRAVIHEAALPEAGGGRSALAGLVGLDDAGISAACADLFKNFLNDDPVAWEALGEDYHRRLSLNYPVWVRQYGAGRRHPPIDPSTLEGKPITWTIGGLTEARHFFSNVRLSQRAGLALELLPCKHFPQVTIPAILADHIRMAASVE